MATSCLGWKYSSSSVTVFPTITPQLGIFSVSNTMFSIVEDLGRPRAFLCRVYFPTSSHSRPTDASSLLCHLVYSFLYALPGPPSVNISLRMASIKQFAFLSTVSRINDAPARMIAMAMKIIAIQERVRRHIGRPSKVTLSICIMLFSIYMKLIVPLTDL